MEKVHANEYPLSQTLYDLMYEDIQETWAPQRLKINSLGGQDGCKHENHLGENERLKKKN